MYSKHIISRVFYFVQEKVLSITICLVCVPLFFLDSSKCDWHIPVACHNDAFLFLTPLSHIIIWFSPFVVLDVHICRDDDQNTATHSPVLMKEKNLS